MSVPTTTIDISSITYSGKQVLELSECIYSAIFKNPKLNELVSVIPGIKAKQQIVILGLLGLVGKTKSTLNCAPDVSTQTVPSVEKWWDPEVIEDRFVECYKDMLDNFFAWGLNNGIDKADLTGTDFALFLEDRISTSQMEAVLRIMYFGDKAADTVANSGTLTNGTDKRYFNAIDGIWKQVFAIATALPNNKVSIAKNAGNSYASQKFTIGALGSNTDVGNQVITGVFQTMIDNADTRLTDDPSAEFWVTKSVADQYKRERKAFTNIDISYTRSESGIQQLEIDGRKINVVSFWDRTIQAYFNNGTTTYLPHRILFTTKSNMQLGVEQESDLGKLEPFYDKRDKQFYIDMLFTIDAKVIEDYKIMMAY